MLVRMLLACLPIVIPAVAAAQSGGTAHLYAYRIKDRAAFEAGYRQHLRWHARHADKLAWFAWYVTSGEWRERAGGYAIQGRGAALVAAIDGDYSNVVGLPVATLLDLAPGLLRGGY